MMLPGSPVPGSLLPGLLLAALSGDGAPGVPAPVRAAADGPRLLVLDGVARVRAGEASLRLGRGESLPGGAPLTDRLELEAGARARVSTAAAALELRGPLVLTPDPERTLGFQLQGTGRARVESRTACVELELASTARLALPRGLYWIEGLTGGGWRIGCDAGESLALRPLEGLRWAEQPRVSPGESLRLVPARFAGPKSDLAGGRLALSPWSRFSWPWAAEARDDG